MKISLKPIHLFMILVAAFAFIACGDDFTASGLSPGVAKKDLDFSQVDWTLVRIQGGPFGQDRIRIHNDGTLEVYTSFEELAEEVGLEANTYNILNDSLSTEEIEDLEKELRSSSVLTQKDVSAFEIGCQDGGGTTVKIKIPEIDSNEFSVAGCPVPENPEGVAELMKAIEKINQAYSPLENQ